MTRGRLQVVGARGTTPVRARIGSVLVACALLALVLPGSAEARPTASGSPLPPSVAAAATQVATGPRARWHDQAAAHASRSAAASATRSGDARAADGSTAPVPAAAAVALDRRTGTLYVAGGVSEGAVYVLDARRCTAQRTRCGAPLASVPTGAAEPVDIVVDPGTGTIYVSNANTLGSGTVSVLDGRRCNARDVSGCTRPVTQVPTGGLALGLQLDRRTHTLYVGNAEAYVGVVDTRACNAPHPSGCTGLLARARTGTNPVFPYLDRATDTLYVPQNDFGTNDLVDVLDARTCNATDVSGCSREPATFPVGTGAEFAVVDHRTGTLYVSSSGNGEPFSGAASVVDARRCNARTTAGCPTSPPPTTLVGPDAFSLAVDPGTHSLYGLATSSDLVSVADTRHCRAGDTSRCKQHPRTLQTGVDPFWMTLDRRTGTVYVANHADGNLQVLDAARCSALRSSGCRREAPKASLTDDTRVLPAVGTIYSAWGSLPTDDDRLHLVDTRTCNLRDHGDCRARASVDLGYHPGVYADPGTSTLYLLDLAAEQVHLVDARTCNVRRQDGCRPFADVHVPRLGGLYVDPGSHTVYVDQDGTTIAVLPLGHCTALDRSRCDVDAREVELGSTAYVVAFDAVHDSVYVGQPNDGRVAVLPRAACDAGTSACAVVAQSAVAGVPVGMQTVPGRHTLYVAGSFGADVVTLVDTATCNAAHPSGCGTTWPTTAVPHVPFGLDLDAQANRVVVTTWDGNVTVLDPGRCSVAGTRGCDRSWPRVPVGFSPVYVNADPRHDTLYAFDYYAQTVSFLDLRHPCRPHLCVRPPAA